MTPVGSQRTAATDFLWGLGQLSAWTCVFDEMRSVTKVSLLAFPVLTCLGSYDLDNEII